MTRVIEDEENALDKALNIRASRSGVRVIGRRGTGGEYDDAPNEEYEGMQRMSKGGFSREDFLKFDKAAGANEIINWDSCAHVHILEMMAATYVDPENPKALEASKHARTSRFGMPLDLIKVAERIQNECFYPESDFVGTLGFCLRLSDGALSEQKHRFPLHLMAVLWKKNHMRPLWEKEESWEPMGWKRRLEKAW